MQDMKDKILFIVGIGGSGKSSLVEELCAMNPTQYKRIIMATTRPKRNYECDIHTLSNLDYQFISEEQFKELDKRGKFIHTQKVQLLDKTTYYGFPYVELDNLEYIHVVSGPYDTYKAVKEVYGKDVISVYLKNSYATSLDRMLKRVDPLTDEVVLEACRRLVDDYQCYHVVDEKEFDIVLDTDTMSFQHELSLIHTMLNDESMVFL